MTATTPLATAPLVTAPAATLLTVAVLHVVLLGVLIALVALDRARVPRGGIWVAILLLVPVLGPLVVLARGRRTEDDATHG